MTVLRSFFVEHLEDDEYYEEGIKKYIKLLSPFFIDDCTISLATVVGNDVVIMIETNKKGMPVFTFKECDQGYELPLNMSYARWRFLIYKTLYEHISLDGSKDPFSNANMLLNKIKAEVAAKKNNLLTDLNRDKIVDVVSDKTNELIKNNTNVFLHDPISTSDLLDPSITTSFDYSNILSNSPSQQADVSLYPPQQYDNSDGDNKTKASSSEPYNTRYRGFDGLFEES